jgi:lathosterol oxidase
MMSSSIETLSTYPFVVLAIIGILYFALRTSFAISLGSMLQKSKWALQRRIDLKNYPKSQFMSELKAGILVVVTDGLIIASVIFFKFKLPTNSSLLLDFVGFLILFVWFEIWFFFTHKAFHTKYLYFIHRQHHVASIPHPLTSISFSILERVTLMGGALLLPLLLTNYLPISINSVAAYGLFNIFMNVIGHSNIEIYPKNFLASWLGKCIATPTYHLLHHRFPHYHYGLFTSFLDKLFGHTYAKYPQWFDQAHRRNLYEK